MLAAQEIVLGGDPYLNFINSLKSDATKKGYRNSLIRFMRHFDITDTLTLSKLPTKDIELYLIKYFEFLKQLKVILLQKQRIHTCLFILILSFFYFFMTRYI